jgi:hypothetical protein
MAKIMLLFIKKYSKVDVQVKIIVKKRVKLHIRQVTRGMGTLVLHKVNIIERHLGQIRKN